jgi:hypothetical protein
MAKARSKHLKKRTNTSRNRTGRQEIKKKEETKGPNKEEGEEGGEGKCSRYSYCKENENQ